MKKLDCSTPNKTESMKPKGALSLVLYEFILLFFFTGIEVCMNFNVSCNFTIVNSTIVTLQSPIV